MGTDPHISTRYDRLAPIYGALHWLNTLGQDREYRKDAVQVLSDLFDGSPVSDERDIKGVFGGLRKVLKDLWTHPQKPIGPQRDLDDVIIGDYGSGQGHMTQHLYETMAARGAQVVALDGSQGMLKRAKGDRVQGSMYAVPLKDNTLDAVVMSYSAGSAKDTRSGARKHHS